MSKSYPDIIQRISSNMKGLRNNIPETMQGFSAMAKGATADGVLDKKTKELIALGQVSLIEPTFTETKQIIFIESGPLWAKLTKAGHLL